MVLGFALVFLFGFLIGGFFGGLAVVLGIMAKRNVETIPETPISVTREGRPLPVDA